MSRERELKVSMGIWENTNLRDHFNPNGYKDDVLLRNRIREVVPIKGIKGIELHFPTEITWKNYKQIEKILQDYDLRIVQLCGHA